MKYMVVKDSDGNVEAHGLSYSLKEGEEQVDVVEASSVDAATRKAQRTAAADDAADEEDADAEVEDDLTEEEAAERDEEQRQAEEAEKEDFTVMSTPEGVYYVEGEDGDPKRKKTAAPAKPVVPEGQDEPVEVGVFRAKSAADAIKMAKGEAPNNAQGAARGAQTP